jgi:hypothetical protein
VVELVAVYAHEGAIPAADLVLEDTDTPRDGWQAKFLPTIALELAIWLRRRTSGLWIAPAESTTIFAFTVRRETTSRVFGSRMTAATPVARLPSDSIRSTSVSTYTFAPFSIAQGT